MQTNRNIICHRKYSQLIVGVRKEIVIGPILNVCWENSAQSFYTKSASSVPFHRQLTAYNESFFSMRVRRHCIRPFM